VNDHVKQYLILQGPNLNLLGQREPELYGSLSLAEVHAGLERLASELGVQITTFQSNHEGALIDAVQAAAARGDAGCVVNAGGYSHTSVALRDVFAGTRLPYVEVHISNLAAREPFRHQSLLSSGARGVVYGFGPAGYQLALRGIVGSE
jgi:3-dehydroquinate dehydratase-2